MALIGHSGSQRVQSMHSSGSITRKLGPSRKQSTGQTSTQSVYLHLMQLSVTTCVIADPLMQRRRGQRRNYKAFDSAVESVGAHAFLQRAPSSSVICL